MRQEERRSYILKQLNDKSSVTVSELSEAFGLSEVSVRKLLVSMEQEGVLKRTWGGAVSAYGSLREFSHQEKEFLHKEEKTAIARAAYDCISDGEAVFLDSGTTTIQLARLMVTGPKRNIMVCTNSIHIAMELSKAGDLQVIVTGGELRANIYSCVGSLAAAALDQLYFDKGFVTGNHFTLEHGFTTPIPAEAELKLQVLKASKEKFILMDYTKFGDDSLVSIAPPEGVDVLITDWHMPKSVADEFLAKGVKVIAAR